MLILKTSFKGVNSCEKLTNSAFWAAELLILWHHQPRDLALMSRTSETWMPVCFYLVWLCCRPRFKVGPYKICFFKFFKFFSKFHFFPSQIPFFPYFDLMKFWSMVFFLVFLMGFRPQVVFARIYTFPINSMLREFHIIWRTEVVWKLLVSVFWGKWWVL